MRSVKAVTAAMLEILGASSRCPRCTYCLAGLAPSGVCPECGFTYGPGSMCVRLRHRRYCVERIGRAALTVFGLIFLRWHVPELMTTEQVFWSDFGIAIWIVILSAACIPYLARLFREPDELWITPRGCAFLRRGHPPRWFTWSQLADVKYRPLRRDIVFVSPTGAVVGRLKLHLGERHLGKQVVCRCRYYLFHRTGSATGGDSCVLEDRSGSAPHR